jgi:hypothetical protein
VFSVIVNLNEDTPVALLEEVSLSLEEIPFSEAVGPESTSNPLRNANLDMMDKSVLAEIEQIILYFKRRVIPQGKYLIPLIGFRIASGLLGIGKKSQKSRRLFTCKTKKRCGGMGHR